ncbi:MAG: hypothetical protein PHD20_02885 [Clostridia bacterium]|nr:hypothetical protein [Clostridia bacterium]
MKIEINRTQNMFGKNNGYIATFGEWQEAGKTKEEAKENLITAINWFMEESDFMPKFATTDTRIIMLNRNFNGYSITAINKEDASQSFTSYGRITRLEAEDHFVKCVIEYVKIGA